MPQTHPERVSELVVRGIYTLTKAELDWYYQFGVSEMFPDKWERFVAPIPEAERGDMMAAYRKRLTGTIARRRWRRARAWSLWEGETITLLPDPETQRKFGEDDFAIAFARIENHYFVHAGWLEEGQLIRDAHKLKDIPGVIVHGRYDMPCPARYAWALHKAWPEAEFHLIEGRRARLLGAGDPGSADPGDGQVCGEAMKANRLRCKTRERLYLFDTTLRDGQQTPGIDFSVEDKIAIAKTARRVRPRLCRGRLSRRQPDRHGLFRREAHGTARNSSPSA